MLNNQQNKRYSKADNNKNNITINNQTTSNINTLSKEPKREPLASVPMVNNIGDENSFFNAIIHMLYFTSEIYEYLSLNKSNFSKNFEILYELFKILEKYDKLLDRNQYYLIPEDERYIDVKNLREKISELYKGEKLFQLGNMDEPSEILYFFLNSIHSFSIDLISPKYYIQNEVDDICDPKCLSHELFDMHLLQQIECLNCKNVGNIKKFPNKFFILDINYNLISKNIEKINKYKYISNIFFRQAKKQFQFSDEICPKQCENPKVINRLYIMQAANYLVFNIKWKEIKPTLQDVCKCYFMISRVFHNSEIFDVLDKDLVADYSLYGFISYWNGHYISFYLNKFKEWFFYEDMRTKKMNTWKDIVIYCIKNHYHPIMLFYKKTDSRVAVFENQILEKDFNEIMEYCKTVDEETLDKNLNDINKNKINIYENKFIRPTIFPNKTKDKNLIKIVENLQKLEEMKEKKKKMRYLDEAEENDNTGMIPEGINIFAGKWICHKCHNHNNISSYQCSKCQEINVKVFEIIYNTKNQRGAYRRNFKNNPSKFEILTKNFEKNYSNLIKIKLNLSQKEETYEKIKKMQEEEDYKLQIERAKKLNENKIKFEVNSDGSWNCIFCGFFNENDKIDFCENCKFNKPKNNELIEKIDDSKIITSLKQY